MSALDDFANGLYLSAAERILYKNNVNTACAELAALRAQRDELVGLCERLLPYLPDENDMLNYASLNEGRASEYDILAVKIRKAVASIRKEQS